MIGTAALSDLLKSTNLQRTAYVGGMAFEKMSDLTSQIPGIQYCYADKLITDASYASQSAFPK